MYICSLESTSSSFSSSFLRYRLLCVRNLVSCPNNSIFDKDILNFSLRFKMAPKRSAATAGLAAPSASSKGPKRAKTKTTGSVAAVSASSSSAQTSVPSSQAAPSTRSTPQRFSAVDDMRIIYLKEFLHWGGSQLDAAMQAHGRTWRQVQPQYSRAL